MYACRRVRQKAKLGKALDKKLFLERREMKSYDLNGV